MIADAEPTTILDARAHYLRANGFDADYGERWVKLKAGPIPIWFPNAPGRVRAVKLHDLHHVVTGYATTWTGEAEIAAWELASGCGRYGWAWALNLSALPIGLAIAPRATLSAFVRGRSSRNLYQRAGGIDAALLARPVSALRAELELDRPAARAGLADVLGLAAFGVTGLAQMLIVPALLVWLAW